MLSAKRQSYLPKLPSILHDLSTVHLAGETILRGEKKQGRSVKPFRVGVVFSGGQAPGGHNVVTGLFDALKKIHPESRLFGFLDGPVGIMRGEVQELHTSHLDPYRNQGGFDLLGSGRDKIETPEQFAASQETITRLDLDGVVIVGGDDSNTNAALLAEYLLQKKCPARVVGVPKTIDGDLQNSCVQIPFGFDSACKIYSEMIGNIARDALSSKKYYHFIKLMGRSASHITLECALATHPNCALIAEEKKSFDARIHELCALIEERASLGKHYGVILIPEGLIEFMPQSDDLFAHLERDQHGHVNFSLIETELLVLEAVKKVCKEKFQAVRHFFGYEGRSGLPSNFDANYCYALGHVAALLISQGHSGYMAFVDKLTEPVEKWTIGGIPLSSLLHMEERKGKQKRVIAKTVVDLQGKPYRRFKQESPAWKLTDAYQYPGPMQFFGDPLLTDSIPLVLQ